MANQTDVSAAHVHGTDPQYLIEKITRAKIYEMQYWKEKCFGLSAATLVDRAIELEAIAGCYGGSRKPSKFLCLLLKMLQIQPDREIILEFILNEDYPYVRLLGAVYLRLTGKSLEIYQYLEPLLNDYRRVKTRDHDGKLKGIHVDEIIDALLTEPQYLDITLPFLQKRLHLEEQGKLQPRKSALQEMMETEARDATGEDEKKTSSSGDAEGEDEDEKMEESEADEEARVKAQDVELALQEAKVASAQAVRAAERRKRMGLLNPDQPAPMEEGEMAAAVPASRSVDAAAATPASSSRPTDRSDRDDRSSSRRHREDRSRSRDRDRDRDRRRDSRSRSRDRDRDRRRHRSRSRDRHESSSRRHRDDSRDRSRSRDRSSRHRHSSRSHRDRDRSRSRERRRSNEREKKTVAQPGAPEVPVERESKKRRRSNSRSRSRS